MPATKPIFARLFLKRGRDFRSHKEYNWGGKEHFLKIWPSVLPVSYLWSRRILDSIHIVRLLVLDGKRTAIALQSKRNPLGFQVKQRQEAHEALRMSSSSYLWDAYPWPKPAQKFRCHTSYLRTFFGACQTGTTNGTGQGQLLIIFVTWVWIMSSSSPFQTVIKTMMVNGQVTYNWGYDPAELQCASRNKAFPTTHLIQLRPVI